MYERLVKFIPNGSKLGLKSSLKFATKPTNSLLKATEGQSQKL